MSKKALFIRTANNYDRLAVSIESGLSCQGASRTQQHFKAECDLNNILKKFAVTGVLPQNRLSPRYGDFSNIGDYHACLNAVRSAQSEFEALPASIRARFLNDPGLLIEFLNDDTNRSEAIELGLIPDPNAGSAHPVGEPLTPSPGATES